MIDSQPALAAAAHVQSRVVVISRDPDMPAAGAVRAFPASTATSHLAAVGDVDEIEVDEPAQALATTESAHSANS
jgi:hypothetical protein